jgi:hypothetical protein
VTKPFWEFLAKTPAIILPSEFPRFQLTAERQLCSFGQVFIRYIRQRMTLRPSLRGEKVMILKRSGKDLPSSGKRVSGLADEAARAQVKHWATDRYHLLCSRLSRSETGVQ